MIPACEVAHAAVGEPDRADERIACLKALYGATIGVTESGYEWCPDDEPPTDDEGLAWRWFVRPGDDSDIAPAASPRLATLMRSYRDGTLDGWWRRLVDSPGG